MMRYSLKVCNIYKGFFKIYHKARYHRILPKYTYHYFDVKGLGEAPRLLFIYAGQEFEDVRYNFHSFAAFKSTTLFGNVPVLFIDSKQYAQSIAISRYLGKKYGLYGDTDEEALEVDQNVDFVNEIRAKAASVHYELDEAIRDKKHEEFTKNEYPDMLTKLNGIIEKNNGYLACGKLTWGDFFLAGMVDYFKVILLMPDLEKKYPAIKKVADNVYSIPKIKAYADTVPATFFGY